MSRILGRATCTTEIWTGSRWITCEVGTGEQARLCPACEHNIVHRHDMIPIFMGDTFSQARISQGDFSDRHSAARLAVRDTGSVDIDNFDQSQQRVVIPIDSSVVDSFRDN